MENITGYDISPDMVRLSLVNMYLHGSQYGLQNPNIVEYDTLSQTDRWDEKFDVILANPPFMTPKGGVMPHNKFEVSANRAEVLFVDYIKTHLKPNGRAGIIIPEGVIFQSSNAYKELRKLLVEDGLYAVVSLPSGVFNPYSGVKTSILFFDNTISKQTKKVLFIKIDNDGYDLGAQRREHAKNDLPNAAKILKDFKNKPDQKLKDITFSWVVEKTKILESDDYSLMGERYNQKERSVDQKYEFQKIGDLIDQEFGERITKKDSIGTKFPVYGGGGESFRTDDYNRENKLVISRFAMAEKCARFVNEKFWLMDSGFTFKIKESKKTEILEEYLEIVFLSIQDKIFACARGQAQKNINNNLFNSIEIAVPPIDVQKVIISEIKNKQSIIDGANDLIQKVERERANSGFLFEQLDCEWKEIGKLCDLVNGRAFKPTDWETSNGKNLPIIRIQNLNKAKAEFNYYSGKVDPKLIIENGDLLFSWSGSRGTSFGAHIWKNQKAILNQHIFKVNYNDLVIKKYMYYVLNNAVATIEDNLNGGVGLVHITKGNLEKIKVPVPSKEVQEEIIRKFDIQEKAIESSKDLVEVIEQQIKDIVYRTIEA
jgi:type I restriction enzyme M protein